MRLVVGLGNPGPQYAMTRHNLGMLAVVTFVTQHQLRPIKLDFKSTFYKGQVNQIDTFVVCPQTYMNLSGTAVKDIATFYNIPLQDMLIVFDDLDLPFGTLRFRDSGSAGTHNGMKSVIAELHSSDIPRLRIGIGPKPPEEDAADFVLASFSTAEKKYLPEICANASTQVAKWLHSD